MKKIASLILSLTLLVITASAAVTWANRSQLPYNSEGSYFDAAESVVYHDSSVTAYGSLTLLLAALTIASTCIAVKAWRR